MTTKITRLIIGVALLSALTLGLNACAKQTTTRGTPMYKRMPAKEHAIRFPEGHQDDRDHICHYDEVGDSYFCPFF